MPHPFKIVSIAITLGIFTCSHVIAAESSRIEASKSHGKPIQLKDLLTTDYNYTPISAGLMTITPGGDIHFLKAAFYNGACSGPPLGIASVIDNGAGFHFDSGQTVSLNASAAYILANNLGITPIPTGCLALYMDGSNATSNSVGCNTYTDEICSGSTCTSQRLPYTPSWSPENQGDPCTKRYMYIPSYAFDGSLTKCEVNALTHEIENCGDPLLGFTGTYSIALNNGYAYITGGAGGDNNNLITQCSINPADGELTCGTPMEMNAGVIIPWGITINKGYAYIVGNNTNNVGLCTISPVNGDISCNATTGSNFSNGPRAIAISNNYAYIANSGNSTITKCTINEDGTLSPCAPQTNVGVQPSDIAIYNGYVYVTTSDNNSVLQCAINPSNGNLTTPCASAVIADASGTSSITIMDGYAYISVGGNAPLYKCSIDSMSGVLSCTGATTGGGATFLAPGFPAIF